MAISAPPEPPAAATTRSLAVLTDSELVAEVRRGCDRAFEQLYGRYHRRITAYIYGMVDDYGRAEDLAQDVFISTLRRMRETDRPIAFKPWVYEIAKNACIDQFRRTRRGEEVSFDAEEGLGAADHGRLVAREPAPDVAVDQKMAIDHLRGAFGGLSQTHHEILVMREFEGLSYREIGERLGLSRPSVESTLFRARRRLGEEYEELVSGRRCRRVQSIIGATDAAPGARDQRRLAAHLSHCQPCRRHAKVAGMDGLALLPRGIRTKVAALVPLPVFLRRRGFGEEELAPVVNPHVSSLAQLSAQLGASIDPAVASWARAIAAAATIAVAGVAGGASVGDGTRSGPSRPVAEQGRASSLREAAPAVSTARATPDPPQIRTIESAGRAPGLVPARPEPTAGTVTAAAVPAVGAPPPIRVLRPATVVGSLRPDSASMGGGRLDAAAEASAIAVAAEAAATAAAQASVASAIAVAVADATADETASSAATSGADTRTDLQGTADKAVDAASAAAKAASEPLLGR